MTVTRGLYSKGKYVCVVYPVVQLCLILCNMDCSPPGSSVHGISQARILEQVVIPYSRALPNPGIKPASLVFLHWQVGSLPLYHLLFLQKRN